MKQTFVVVFFLTLSTAFAGGPLSTFNGKPVRYKSDTVHYHLDRGRFGIFSNEQARALANASFAVWEDVPTATIRFDHEAGDTLPVDVDASNFLQYTTLTSVTLDGVNPIVFDSDGGITDALFGSGAANSVIGFAWTEDTDGDGFYDEGEAFMNGKFADGTANGFTYEEWKSTFVHEIGHFLGLDHTQINGEFADNASTTVYVPTMYPTATVNDVPLGDLNPDDIAAISLVYPDTSFAAATGSISGSVTRTGGAAVRGANVIAHSTGSDSLMNRISTITDYYELNSGDYTIAGLASGSYAVLIEPIDESFTEGSSVGPYSYESTGLSFVNPVPREYYNGANESGDAATDHPAERSAIDVAAGAATGGIDFIANTAASPQGTLLSDDFTDNAGTALTDAGWMLSGSSVINPITIVQPGLTFAGTSSPGNAAFLTTNGQDLFRSFPAVAEGSVYLSFLINVDSAKTGDYFAALSPANSQTNYFARVHLKASGTGYAVGISKQSETTGGAMYGSTILPFGLTALAVVKYEFLAGAANDDRISVFMFSSSAVPPEEPGTAEITAYTYTGKTDPPDIGIVTLRQGNSAAAPVLRLDRIRVSTAWPQLPLGVDGGETGAGLTGFALEQNFPNPFNPSTTIRYSLPVSAHVHLAVYDLLGKKAVDIVDGVQKEGMHAVSFDGSSLSSGIYFYQLRAGALSATKKFILMK